MRKIFPILLVIFIFLASPALCASSTERLYNMPDLTQTDPSAHFPHGGVHYCAPCAISNALVWLAHNGYGKLLPATRYGAPAQAKLAMLLASDKYMDTTLEWGTSPAGVLEGLARYLADCGYLESKLSYQGWRKVPSRFHTGVKVPQLQWVESGMRGDSVVLLNVGWYRYSRKNNEYRRIGGHWVTLAGYGMDREGHEDPNVLIIHDPGSASGMQFSNDYVLMKKIKGGTIKSASGVRQDAAGFFKMGGGMKVHCEADIAILDGAIRLEMKRTTT